MNDQYVAFWHGPFSQWWPSKFEHLGTTYNCCEQYMMAMKAMLFSDFVSYEKIMAADGEWGDDIATFTKYPRRQKELGREVSNFNSATWDANCMSVVRSANLLKFSQNKKLLDMMVAVGDRKFVEGSPYDRIWGVGLKWSDSRSLDPATWRGENKLGDCLTFVRDELLGKNGE